MIKSKIQQYEQDLISDLIFNREINASLSKMVFDRLNDQYLEEKYNQVRKSDYLGKARKNLKLDMIGYMEQICENLKANLDVGNLVNIYVTAIKENLTHNTWEGFYSSTDNKENHISY